jgi:hypothetical protein
MSAASTKATAAAAKYMSNMYAIFGDWELVLALVYSGPGNVLKQLDVLGKTELLEH